MPQISRKMIELDASEPADADELASQLVGAPDNAASLAALERRMHREQRGRILAELRRLRLAGWVVVAARGPVLGTEGWHVNAWRPEAPEALIQQHRANLRDAYAHVIMACDAADWQAAQTPSRLTTGEGTGT